MPSSVLDSIKQNLSKARAELNQKRKDIQRQIAALERQLAALDRDYAMLDGFGSRRGQPQKGHRPSSRLGYGGVRSAVLEAIKSAKGVKPAQIIGKTGLSSQQVHNALTGLKKSKDVKPKDGLYFVA